MTYDYKQDFPIFQHTDVAYIDNAATAQRPQCVLDAMADFYRCHNANPLRGLYPLSVEATDIYEQARETVRDFIGARSAREIVFTRNTTESLNLVAYSYGLTHVRAGDEVLVSIMEHHSDLLPWQMVCRQTGAELKFIECAPDGSVDLRQIESLITERTKIVAMTQVSNVLGRKYPVQEVAAMAHKKGAVMVVDGAQSTPHIPVDVQALDSDFFAFSGHKVYGPKGIGALYVRRKPRVRIECQIHGGGHERGMRSGTLATHQIVGMGEAYRLAKEEMETEMPRLARLRDRLWDGIRNNIPEVYLNGSMEHRSPHNLNVSFAFIEGESLMMAMKDIAVSSGSACTSASLEPSYVLRALGRDDELAHSSIRFTLGRFTTEEEIDYVIKTLVEGVTRLREMSPLWEMHQQGVDLNQVQWSEH